MLCTVTSEDTMTMIMMTENLTTKITLSNLQIPFCRHDEIRKDSQKYEQRFCKNCEKVLFSKIKLTGLLMKKHTSFPSKICPVF